MKLEEFLNMYDKGRGIVTINDNNLNLIVQGELLEIIHMYPTFSPTTEVENYGKLFEMEVVSFGFYDDELCVRVK